MKHDDSVVWKDLLKLKHLYTTGRIMLVGNGQSTDFWNDAWRGTSVFCDKFPQPFDICSQQQITVADAGALGWQFNFCRWMNPEIQSQWRQMRDHLATIALNEESDKPKWKYTKNGIFSVKSMYEKLSAVGIDRSFKYLWKSKLPLKIKIWLWLIWHNVIATKDNMKKRKCVDSYVCRFCPSDETIIHLFFTCLWRLICGALLVQCWECIIDPPASLCIFGG
jgi:hypothetical protein